MDSRSSPDLNFSKDILFSIMVNLSVEQIVLLLFISQHFRNTINPILQQEFFWQENAKRNLPSDRFKAINNYMELGRNRYFFHSTIKRSLANSKFITPSVTYFFTGIYSGLSGDNSFTIDGIKPFLIDDNAEGLFKKVHKYPELFALIKTEDHDVTAINSFLQGNSITPHALCFIGLLPAIMEMRAINCFKLFLRAYFALSYRHFFHEGQNFEYHRALYKFCHFKPWLFLYSDDYFKKLFIAEVIKVAPVDDNILSVINDALDAKYHDVLVECFHSIPKEKFTQILAEYEDGSILKQTLKDIYNSDKSKVELITALSESLTVLGENSAPSKAELLKMQSKIEACFSLFIDDRNYKADDYSAPRRMI